MNREIPIVADAMWIWSSEPLLKITPAHDPNAFEVGPEPICRSIGKTTRAA